MRKGNEETWKRSKRIKKIFSCKLVLIGLIAFILMLNLARAMSNEPQIINAKVDPLKVQPGDILITTVEFKDDYGIISAVASYEHEKDSDEILMSLIEGDKYEGTYKAAWVVHDTEIKKYYTTVYLTNKIGLTSMKKLEWWDPEVGHSASAISADAFDSGNFTFQDDLYINDRLGIGTTNPTYKLQVELTTGNTDDSITTSQIKGIKINETTSTGGYSDMGLIMGSGAGESAFITGHRVSTSSIDLSLGASDVEVIRIKGSTGKVGIGTSNPQQELNVVGELNVTQGLNLSMYQSCTALETDASGNVLCGSDDGGSMDYTNLALENRTNYFTSLQHFGAGLNITGDVNITGDLNITGGVNLSSFTSCTTLETDAEGNLVCGSDDSGTGGVQDYTNIAMTNQSNSFGNHDQIFDTDTLFLDSAGDKIGIGTIEPQQKLNVVGDINFTGNLSLGSANPDYRLTIKPNNNNDGIIIYENDSNFIANEFLGQNSGGYWALYRAGTPQIVMSATGSTYFNGQKISNHDFRIGSGSSEYMFYLNASEDYVSIGGWNFNDIPAGTRGLLINGSVGIGSSNPQQKLNVEGDANITGGLNLSMYQSCTALETDSAGNLLCGSDDGGSTTDGTINSTAWNKTGSNVFLSDSDDNVGIGTATPESKLTVAGDIRAHSGGYFKGAADSWIALAGDTDVYLDIDNDNDGSDKLYIRNGANANVMEVDESGNLQVDGDLTVSGGNINLPFGDNALESVDEWLRINDGGEHSAGVYMGTSVLGVGNTYIGGYDAATGEIDLLANGNINMVGTLTAADIECTKCIDTGDLKTVNTGLLSGTCVTRGDKFSLVMNDYTFFPNFGDNTGTANGYLGFRSYNSITTDDTVGRSEMNCGDPLNYEIRWRYITASRTPELFVWYDLENKVLRQVWHSEIEHPEVLPIEYNNIPKDTDGNPLWIPIQVTVFDKSLLEMDGAELRTNYTITRYEKPENLSSDDELLTKPKEEGAVLITHPEIYYGKLEYCSTCADSLVALKNNTFEQEKPAMPMTNTEENQTAIILENQQKIQELEKRLAALENMIEQSNGSVIIKVK